MIKTFPVVEVHSEKITVPSATAFTGVPSSVAISMAKCLSFALYPCVIFPLMGDVKTKFLLLLRL